MNNHHYIFVIGKNPNLSLAEIRVKFHNPLISILSKNTVLLNLDKEIKNPQEILNSMGGTIKIAKLISIIENEEIQTNLVDFIKTKFDNYRHIGFSYYNFNTNLNKTFLETKKILKQNNINKRFIFENNKNELTAATIKKNKLKSKGAECVIINSKNKQYFAQTIAHQDVDLYTLRDYGKPKPDSRSGMLPPKLAQIMINLAQPKKNSAIYDPFCGSGTVLQEAILQNLHIIGSDISDKAVIQTRENIKWLIKKFDLDIPNYRKLVENNIFSADATYYTLDQKVQSIVCEPYLGPAHRQNPDPTFANQIIENLTPIYQKFLTTSVDNLLKNGHLVFVIPIIISTSDKHTIDLDSLLDDRLHKEYNIIQFEQNDLIYEQPNQKVLRKIVVLQKT